MIVFGWLAELVPLPIYLNLVDYPAAQECTDNSNSGFGRRRMYGVELGIIILATLCCALISSSPAMGSTGLLIFWRIIMVSLHCLQPDGIY